MKEFGLSKALRNACTFENESNGVYHHLVIDQHQRADVMG